MLRACGVSPWLQLCIWVVVAGFLAYGFEFTTPRHTFDALRASDEALALADSLAYLRDIEQLGMLEALTIGECIDRDQREIQLMGLGPTCARLVSQNGTTGN